MDLHYLRPTTVGHEQIIPSSLLDGVNMATTTGAWFYQHSDIKKLLSSLQLVIDAAPYLAGQTRFVKYNPDGEVYQRYWHTEVYYNFPDQKGAEVEVAESEQSFTEITKDLNTELDGVTIPLDIIHFVPSSDKPHPPFSDHPNFRVKITKLTCGVVCISSSVPHLIGDALMLKNTMQAWSDAYNGKTFSVPIFAPRDVDELALSLTEKNQKALDIANALPRAEYDFWASKPYLPAAFHALANGPQELIDREPLGTPCKIISVDDLVTFKFEFTPKEIEKMYQHCSSSTSSQISHMVALVSHFWTCYNRARKLGENESKLQLVIGLRNRLPSDKNFYNYAGSFTDAGEIISKGNASAIENAMLIGNVISAFTKDVTPSLLHKHAMKVCPCRYALGNFDHNSMFVTTWIGTGKATLSFGGDLIFFERNLAPVSGYSVIVEKLGDEQKWYKNGVDIHLTASKAVLEAMNSDPEFRKYK